MEPIKDNARDFLHSKFERSKRICKVSEHAVAFSTAADRSELEVFVRAHSFAIPEQVRAAMIRLPDKKWAEGFR